MLYSHLIEAAKENPDFPLLTFRIADREEKLTYKKILEESLRYASYYQANQVKKGSVVILLLEHGPELIYGFIGATLIGALPTIFAPPSPKISPELYQETLDKLLHLYQGSFLVTDTKEVANHSPLKNLHVDTNPESLAFLQHSSGTTGLKKGVALTHENLLAQISSYSEAIELLSIDKIVGWLPLYHDMGLITSFLLPLVTGTPSLLLSPFDWVKKPESLFTWITQEKATLCWMPNFAFQFMAMRVNSKEYDLKSMRGWISCSEPVTQGSFNSFYEKFKDLGVSKNSLAGCYAMAENTFAVTQTRLGTKAQYHQANFVSSGHVISGSEVKIIEGEIVIRGNSLFKGYYLRPEETDKCMKNGWYYTGDLGYLLNGELFVTGRKKDLIIVAGKNIYPHDIEEGISQLPGIYPGRVVAAGRFNARLGTEEVIILAETQEGFKDYAKLKSQIAVWMKTEFEISPQRVELLPHGWLIKSTSGKPSRSACLEKFERDSSTSAS